MPYTVPKRKSTMTESHSASGHHNAMRTVPYHRKIRSHPRTSIPAAARHADARACRKKKYVEKTMTKHGHACMVLGHTQFHVTSIVRRKPACTVLERDGMCTVPSVRRERAMAWICLVWCSTPLSRTHESTTGGQASARTASILTNLTRPLRQCWSSRRAMQAIPPRVSPEATRRSAIAPTLAGRSHHPQSSNLCPA
jgi:hypothetical protein